MMNPTTVVGKKRTRPDGGVIAQRLTPIALHGVANSGKDTTAEIIASLRKDLVIKRQGWADLLKLSAARNFYPQCTLEEALAFCNRIKQPGHTLRVVDESDGGLIVSITGREYLQRYGTEAHRELFGDDFWLDTVLPKERDDCDILTIPDTRFDNEAERVLGRGGQVWEIVRDDAEPVEGHSTETRIDPKLITLTIENNGSLEELREKVSIHLTRLPLRLPW